MKCPECDQETKGPQQCEHCGAALAAGSPPAGPAGGAADDAGMGDGPAAPEPGAGTCPECGAPLREEATFCGRCGHALAGSPPADAVAPTPPKRPAEVTPAPAPRPGPTCPGCGTPLREEALFCGRCGLTLDKGPTAEPATPTPEPAPAPQPRPEPGPGPVCPGCGKQVDDRWRVCPYCKARLIIECPECGKRMERHWKMCPYCATPLSA